MSIYDLIELFVDDSQSIYVYDLNTDNELFKGDASDIPADLEDMTICSIDNVYPMDKDNPYAGFIGINVDSSDE